MLKNSLLARNVVANVATFGFGLAITFVLSPFLIRTLGDGRYGAWVLISELLGYYGLLDLGIRGAVTFHVGSYLAQEKRDQTIQLIASAFWALAVLGVAAAAGGIGLALAFPNLFVQGAVDLNEIRVAMTILACMIGATLPMEVFSASLVAQQRLDIVNAVDVGVRLLVAVGILVVLGAGGGLVALSILQAVGKVVNWSLLYVFLKRRLPAVSLRPALVRRSELKALTSLGWRTFVFNLAQTVVHRTDLVLIAMFMEVRWVTYYSLGRMLLIYTETAVFEITRAFTPRLIELNAKQASPALDRLYLMGTRFAGVVAMVAVAGVWSFATPFLRLWVGPDYVSGPLTLRSDVVAFLLGVAYLPRMIQSISRQRIFATGRMNFLMRLTIFEAFGNIALTIALIRPYGLAGVAVGTLLPLVFSQVVGMPWYMSKELGISQRKWLSRGLGRPALVGLLTFVFAQLLLRGFAPQTWVVFLTEVLIVCVLALALSFLLVLNAEERASALQMFRS